MPIPLMFNLVESNQCGTLVTRTVTAWEYMGDTYYLKTDDVAVPGRKCLILATYFLGDHFNSRSIITDGKKYSWLAINNLDFTHPYNDDSMIVKVLLDMALLKTRTAPGRKQIAEALDAVQS